MSNIVDFEEFKKRAQEKEEADTSDEDVLSENVVHSITDLGEQFLEDFVPQERPDVIFLSPEERQFLFTAFLKEHGSPRGDEVEAFGRWMYVTEARYQVLLEMLKKRVMPSIDSEGEITFRFIGEDV